MEKRTFIEKVNGWWKENKKDVKRAVLIIASILIGCLIFSVSGAFTMDLISEIHKSEFKLCEEEARNRYSKIIQVMNEFKQSEDFLISYGGEDEMPIIIVKTPSYKGRVIAEYKNGKVKISREISGLETFFSILIAIICVTIYILIVIYIYKRKKRKTASLK